MGLGIKEVAVSIGVFVGFLFFFDPAAVWVELQGVAFAPVVLGLGAVALAVVLWAESMRRLLLTTGVHLPLGRGVVSYSTGMFAKQILPMGNAGGPAIMAYVYTRTVDADLDHCLAVVTIGNALGLLATLVLTLAGIAFVVLTGSNSHIVTTALLAVLAVSAIFVGGGILLLFRRELLRAVVLSVARGLDRTAGRLSARIHTIVEPATVDRGIDRYFETIDTVAENPWSVASAAALALAGWTLFAVPLYTSTLAVGESIPFGLVLFIVPIGGVAAFLPLPGGIGGVELAVASVFITMTPLAAPTVAAIVVLYRLAVYWFLIVLGGAAVTYAAIVGVGSIDSLTGFARGVKPASDVKSAPRLNAPKGKSPVESDASSSPAVTNDD